MNNNKLYQLHIRVRARNAVTVSKMQEIVQQKLQKQIHAETVTHLTLKSQMCHHQNKLIISQRVNITFCEKYDIWK